MKCKSIYTTVLAAAFFPVFQSANAQSNGPMGNATLYEEPHYKPWPRIMEKDIVRKRRVWEEINMKMEHNPTSAFYSYNRKMPLLEVLINGVKDGKISAYSTENDRFTNELKKDEFAAAYGTMTAQNTKIVKFLVKEDSLYVNTGEITVRILGIAPVAAVTTADGTVKEQTLFWIYYPDARPYLASVPVSGTGNWYDIFENQGFKGNITKLGGVSLAENKPSHK